MLCTMSLRTFQNSESVSTHYQPLLFPPHLSIATTNLFLYGFAYLGHNGIAQYMTFVSDFFLLA